MSHSSLTDKVSHPPVVFALSHSSPVDHVSDPPFHFPYSKLKYKNKQVLKIHRLSKEVNRALTTQTSENTDVEEQTDVLHAVVVGSQVKGSVLSIHQTVHVACVPCQDLLHSTGKNDAFFFLILRALHVRPEI